MTDTPDPTPNPEPNPTPTSPAPDPAPNPEPTPAPPAPTGTDHTPEALTAIHETIAGLAAKIDSVLGMVKLPSDDAPTGRPWTHAGGRRK